MEKQEGTTFLDLLPYIGGERYRAVLFGDDVEVGVCACGPVAGLIDDVPGAGGIIDRIVSQAEEIVSRLYTS